MEDIDLYKLPKDILVKLLATIRQDVEKNLEQKYNQQIQKLKIKEEMLKEIKDDLDERGIFYNYERCSHESCLHYMIENENDIICQTNDMFFCEGCLEVYYCSTHAHLYLNSDMLCSSCLGHQPNPQQHIEEPILNEDEEHRCEMCGNDGISVIEIKNLPNTFYSIKFGYIIRIQEDKSVLVVGIMRESKYSIYQLADEKNWEKLTEEEKQQAISHGFNVLII
jgi:hypothetical protein